MPYSGTTVFAKALAKSIDGCTVNPRAEGIWELSNLKPDSCDAVLKSRWNPETELVDRELVSHWKSLVNSSGKRYIVEKSPPLMFHRQSLKEHIPEPRELVLVRDPVQLYLSNRKRQKIDGKRLKTKTQQLEETTPAWTKAWFETFFRRLEKISEIVDDGVELVVYEDFIKSPECCFRNLSALHGISIGEVANSVKVKNQVVEKIELRDKVPGEWLSNWEIDLIGNALQVNQQAFTDLGLRAPV